ncbi:MAG: hypothetical protein ACFFCW_29450 [Candidatus Hodarchaeota archaeon]
MSMLSGLSSHIDQEGELLRDLNDAVLCVQAAILGDTELLDLPKDKVSRASSTLTEFLEKLEMALKKPSDDPTISMLVENIRQESDKTIKEWEAEIQDLIDNIKSEKLRDHPSLLQTIEDVLNLLNADYSAAVKALYYKYR